MATSSEKAHSKSSILIQRVSSDGTAADSSLCEAEQEGLLGFHSSKRRPPNRRFWAALHIAIVSVYTVVFVWSYLSLSGTTNSLSHSIWSPARNKLTPNVRSFNSWFEEHDPATTLFGPPSATIDKAWEALLKPINTWYTQEEIQRFEKKVDGEPVVMTNGKVLGSTTVYHHLHCIKRLYQTLNKDHYYPDLTPSEDDLLLGHSMHCLDFLRQAVQCQADTTPIVLIWAKEQAVPIGDVAYPHSCVNWDSLRDWAVERTVDPYEPGLVVHPILGPAYANMTDRWHQTGLVKATPLRDGS